MLFTEKTTKAMSFANYAHADQKDKSGAPYMLHVYRVADAMDTEDETCAALFHDILEDCSFDIKTAKDVPLPSLYPCGQPVSVRPCGDKETYFGILLGEMPYTSHVSFDRKNGELTVGHMLNSAIYVPKLGRVVYGFESWWQRIDTDEEADKAITDDGIQNQWYMRMLRDAMRGE